MADACMQCVPPCTRACVHACGGVCVRVCAHACTCTPRVPLARLGPHTALAPWRGLSHARLPFFYPMHLIDTAARPAACIPRRSYIGARCTERGAHVSPPQCSLCIVRVHARTHACTHARTNTRARARSHARTLTRTLARARARQHARTAARTHGSTHARTARTAARTDACTQGMFASAPWAVVRSVTPVPGPFVPLNTVNFGMYP